MTVRDNIIDISNDQYGLLFYLTQKSVNSVTMHGKFLKCFSVTETPNAICVTKDGNSDIYVAFHDAGKIMKYDRHGSILMELIHPDPKMVYRARHLTLNNIGDIFFSDDISNVTILDSNGIWKGAINRDATTSSKCGPFRPTGIACSNQRHVFILDGNVTPNVHIFSEEGKYLQTAVFKNLKDAYVLNIDRSGDLWVAFKDGRLRVYRPNLMKDLNKPIS
jgi:ligand-binding sensor domain-containing protein